MNIRLAVTMRVEGSRVEEELSDVKELGSKRMAAEESNGVQSGSYFPEGRLKRQRPPPGR